MLLTGLMYLVLEVPYVPTPAAVVEQMIGLIDWKGNERIVDLGAGDARILIAAKRRHPRIHAVGCEIVPTVWLLGILRCFCAKSDVTLHLRSVFSEDVRRADVLFLYLMPELVSRLVPKFERELKPGALIVSRSFRLPGCTLLRTKKVPCWGSTTSLFLYRWTAPRQRKRQA